MNGEYWVPIRVAIRPLHTISNHFKLCQSLQILPCIQVDKYYLCDKLFKKCFCRIFLAQGTSVNCDLFNTIYCNIINVFISNIFMAYFKTPKYSFFVRTLYCNLFAFQGSPLLLEYKHRRSSLATTWPPKEQVLSSSR